MLLSFIISCFLLAVSPGPDNIYLTALTSKSGKIAGLSFLTGLITGCFVHTTLLAFGLNELLIRHGFFFEIIKYSGVFYLLFLSYYNYKSEILNIYTNNNNKLFKYFKRGALMNLLNPKVFLFFTLFFPNFIYSEIYSFKLQILSLGFIFIAITFIVFGLIILFSNFIHKNFSSNNRFKIFAKYFNVLVLLFIAVLILFTENNLTLTN
ncbi:MAG: lysine transporter LysE [Flavobacteriaceae bacterium]|nr:lysine transporter LysE [Flavobacteriaceae bacterium]|tara:strand:- start:3370 stop:3993 length:624 start_codon:yes stop_codon:yes gene_type:complete